MFVHWGSALVCCLLLAACHYDPIAADGLPEPYLTSNFVYDRRWFSENGDEVRAEMDTTWINVTSATRYGRGRVVCFSNGLFANDTTYVHYEANGDLSMTTEAYKTRWHTFPFSTRRSSASSLRDTIYADGRYEVILVTMKHTGTQDITLADGTVVQCQVVNLTRLTANRYPADSTFQRELTEEELMYNRHVGYICQRTVWKRDASSQTPPILLSKETLTSYVLSR